MVKEFTGKQIAILGFGLEGKSTLEFLRAHGVEDADVTLLDKKSIDDTSWLKTITWPNYLSSLDSFDLIFKTPGITKHMIEEETSRTDIDRSRFTSQTQYFFDTYKGTVIWVTWTKGKSTTVSLLQEMLQHAGKKSILVGNVGKPVLEAIDFTNPPEIVVYELSSFMIDALDTFHVDIAIFTSLYPTHTKEHGGYDAYIQAKFRLLAHADHLLVWSQLVKVAGSDRWFFDATNWKEIVWYGEEGTYTFSDGYFRKYGDKIFSDETMKILWVHNRYNACALLGVCDILQLSYTYAEEALNTFTGLEHRIEYVGTYKDILWFNDAIATTPQATIAAVETFGRQLGTIFLGGSEWEYQFEELAKILEKYEVSNIILFPDTGVRIKKLIDTKKHTIFETCSMEEAVTFAYSHTAPGEVALLSCGSPSFSLWSWFKEKGTQFKNAVVQLANI